ncbi:MAG: hypothetical protein AB1449_03145 [Chloroflexota bacterium]
MTDATLSPEEAQRRVETVRRAFQAELLAKPNVVGVGVGLRQRGGRTTGEVALVVLVRRKVPRHLLAPEECIPAEIEGVPVDVQEVGEIRAQG